MAIDGGDVKASLVLNIKRFLQNIKEATNASSDMADDIERDFEDVESSAENSMGNVGQSLTVLGGGLATAGGAIGASLLLMTDNFNDSQKSLNSFGAQTGITGKDLDKFKGKIESTYLKGYGEDIQEVSDTYSNFQRALKTSADETENLTEKAFQLKDVFGYEIEDSLNAVTSLVKQFGIDGNESYDLIARASQVAGDRAGDLLDTVNEYSKDFSKAGYSADEMFNLLVNGLNNGIMDFDKIGDTVKEFGNVLLQSGDEGVEILKQVTGSSKEAKSMMKGLSDGTLSTKDAMKKVVDGLVDMDDKVLQNQIGASLFGSLWEEAGIKGLEAMVSGDKALGDYNGTLDKANSTLKGNKKTMEQVKREFEQVTNLLGQELAPVLSKALEFASKFISKLLEFGKANPLLLKIVSIGGLVISILGSIAGAVIAVAGLFAEGGILASGISVIIGLFSTIGAVAGAVLSAILTFPVLIGVAIVALVALIIWKWDLIKEYTIKIWEAIKNFILSIPDLIVAGWNAFVELLIGIWETIKTKSISIWNSFLTFMKSVPSKLYNFFTSTLPTIIGYVVGKLFRMGLDSYNKINNFFYVKIPQLIAKALIFIRNLFTQYIPQFISKIGNMVVSAYNKFKLMKEQLTQKSKEILTNVLNYFKQLPSKIGSQATAVYNKAKELGRKMIEGVKSQVKNLPSTISNAISNAIKGVGSWGSKAYSALKSIGSSMWSGFKKGLGINSPSYIEEAMFAIDKEGANLQSSLFNTFRRMKNLPQISSLSDLANDNIKQQSNDNRVTQNFNSPLVQIVGGNETTGKTTAYSLYDMITFNKRALGVK